MSREHDEPGPSADEPSESEIKQGKETNPHRTADIGESGQFAPGGYYNQQSANEEHIDLDEQFDSSSKP
ncbi:MAG TPA: hypothetical protein VGA87_01750 [Pyrinomonadaceae bacterium]|jgi:hypothetical protein